MLAPCKLTVYLCIHAIVLSIMLQDGDTALYLAACWGKLEVAKMLVRYGAAVDIRKKVSLLPTVAEHAIHYTYGLPHD